MFPATKTWSLLVAFENKNYPSSLHQPTLRRNGWNSFFLDPISSIHLFSMHSLAPSPLLSSSPTASSFTPPPFYFSTIVPRNFSPLSHCLCPRVLCSEANTTTTTTPPSACQGAEGGELGGERERRWGASSLAEVQLPKFPTRFSNTRPSSLQTFTSRAFSETWSSRSPRLCPRRRLCCWAVLGIPNGAKPFIAFVGWLDTPRVCPKTVTFRNHC